MILWDIYEIAPHASPLVDVKCRGRVRKFAVEHGIDLLVENASDDPGKIRIALIAGSSPEPITRFLRKLFGEVAVIRVQEGIPNPVLSKLKVNILERYEI